MRKPDQIVERRTSYIWRNLGSPFLALMMLWAAASGPVLAASDTKPYDDRLLRLSEILGAVHYLRELCGANEGQYWRDRMRDLMDAEGSTALRRAKLTRAFNQGYRSYSRTYNTCSPSAQTAINRFLSEGSELSDGLLKAFPN
ncbi:TIGR02301 family protein [Hyphomicrobium sp. ghe19]|uniref:TIGR02301 family protein n=1 Tax=Hyphomicrobium sp. ghe19 TaxID=2682968 RepID=UPI00136766A8|nr:hypothetical protein HYPP_02951 [Hyphomicrobium sp. ghe19]